jgi:serine/threonine protein kinase
MPLTPGTRLGPYEVLAPVGAGGMGEVYRAKDTRLDRDVAIKVLPAAVAQDAERLSRFEREAKVVASLNHPNIAQIYGIEENGDASAIVMELVAGATLEVPQPLETALLYARQIAEALEAAHDKGITHRDLKPANIMITPEGVVKILDFGLATAPGRDERVDPTNSPTFTMAATQAGIIMGTAGYMSPEQAAGKPVDRRSDIWSFGVVLWEMLTGTKLFEGETVSHTIADVLRAPIEFGKLPPSTPAPIAELVKRCLDRNVRTRLQSIGEARIAIERYLKDPTAAVELPRQALVAPAKAGWAPWITAAVFAIAAAGLGLVAYRHWQEPPPRTLRVSVTPPDQSAFVGSSLPAISPDGKKLAFSAIQDGKTTLWVRDLESISARSITGTAGAINPFWSPDSKSIGFHADSKLKRVDFDGGAVLTLCATQGNFHGASWSSRGVIIFSNAPAGPLHSVPAAGGAPSPLTALDEAAGEISHRLPWFLPDGRRYIYTVRNLDQTGKSGIYAGDLDSRERKLVFRGEAHAAYVPAGDFLVYAQGGITEGPLMAQAIDPSTLRTIGDPVPIVESVNLTTGVWASHQFSVSLDGTLVYASSGALGNTQLTWVDRSGKALGTLGEPDPGIFTAAISPDGSTAVSGRAQNSTRDVWLYDIARGVSSRLKPTISGPRESCERQWRPAAPRSRSATGAVRRDPWV